MVKIIYGDVLLLIDFCMNFFILHTTSIVLRRRIKGICIAASAFVGGAYSVAKLFIEGNDIIDCIISVFMGLLMCYIAFGGYDFLKTAIAFFCSSSLVGGIMFCTYFGLGSFHTDIFGNTDGKVYSHIPLWLFTVLAAISLIIAWIFTYLGREKSEKEHETVEIVYKGRKTDARLILDSGNFAKEPISGKYVIMLNKSKSRILIGEELFSDVVDKNTERLLKNRFRVICVSGITEEYHTYYVFLPDEIYIKNASKKTELDAYIAVCAKKTDFSGCDGLTHPAVIL